MNLKVWASLLTFGGLAACGSLTGNNRCNAIEKHALVITVRDAGTGAATASNTRTVVTKQGGATDTSIVGTSATLDDLAIDAFDVPGTYDVQIDKPGYVTWSVNGILVSADRNDPCHPATVYLRADLQRQP